MKHVVEVEVLGTHPRAAKDSWVSVDAFKVGAQVTEQSAGPVRERFHRVKSASASGGSYDTTMHQSGGDTGSAPYYQLAFRGPGSSSTGRPSPPCR